VKLRDYQEKVKADVYAAWANGLQNVVAQLSTAAGKTVIFSDIARDYSTDYVVAIAHRVELVSQMSLTFARYGIRHNIIAPRESVREIVAVHMRDLKRSYYDLHARCHVAGVDTLIRMNPTPPWFDLVKLVIQDEAHHVLRDNKWGRAAALFPNARGLYPTATPTRADGCGLGRHADGIMDALVIGPPMRNLIDRGYLSDYRIIAPPNDLDLSDVNVTPSGDYSPPRLRTAVRRSRIVGDVVKHYQKFAAGKLGVTFAVSIEAATEIAAAFRAEGIAAEVISGKTPDLLRATIMDRFRRREILQLVNVDLLGEGVDVPAIEVISMARPTCSYAVYAQQFGRALRPMPGKDYAIIIDHVGNWTRHGPPDKIDRVWTLDRRERRSKASATDVPATKTCLNEECLSVYERIYRACPFCGHYTPPAERGSPEFVDGDLLELDPRVLAQLRGEINRVDGMPRIPQGVTEIARRGIFNRHMERQREQAQLRETIALWAGYLKARGYDDSRIYRVFYLTFGTDIATAQTLGTREACELNELINKSITNF
jgi:DNA repair protein RadD